MIYYAKTDLNWNVGRERKAMFRKGTPFREEPSDNGVVRLVTAYDVILEVPRSLLHELFVSAYVPMGVERVSPAV